MMHKKKIYNLALLFGRSALAAMAFMLLVVSTAVGFEPKKVECLAPAKRGGGHDITCQLLVRTLQESLLLDAPISIRYMPGGIGALAYNYNINQRTHDPQVITAASTGSLLNIALNKFGGYSDRDVRWLGGLGTDFGIVAVRTDSTLNTLEEMVGGLKIDSRSLVFGVAGSIGSQDWMKAALILDVGGLDPLSVRYISYEGGGEAVNSLLKGHIDVFTGELAEVASFIDSEQIKVLAVLAEKRLEGVYASISTAREQGFDVVWPVWRGYYLPPGIKDDEYRWWVNTLRRLSTTKEFQSHRRKLQLFPFLLVGEQFDLYVRDNVDQMREVARKFNLVK